MGKGKRERPVQLGRKLSVIRKKLGLSQNGMLRHLGLQDKLSREEISAYERGVREPTLITLLKYAHAAGVYVDVLIDDEMDLPKDIPSKLNRSDIKSTATKRVKK